MTDRAIRWFTVISLSLMFIVLWVNDCKDPGFMDRHRALEAERKLEMERGVEPASDEQMREWMRRIREAVESERDA
jgi:hypothetical protein